MGRRVRIILLFVALFVCLPVVNGQAAGVTSNYNIEQAQGNAPTVKAYINGAKTSDKMVLSAQVTGTEFPNGIAMRQEGVQSFERSGEAMHYIVLLDNSASVDEKQFAVVKKQLVKFRQTMKDKDALELYTVGSNASRGNKSKVAVSNGKNNVKADCEKIKRIKRNKGKTVLYRSLTQILQSADNAKTRTVILIITDGEDDSQGKNNKTYEVNPLVKTSKIPIYGILLKNVSRKPNKEKMANTRKNILNEQVSRGYYAECASTKSVARGFAQLQKIWKQTYVTVFREENNSNKITTNASLVISSNGQEARLTSGAFSYNTIGEDDTVAPELSAVKKTGSKSIEFCLKDDKTAKIFGAEKKENYTVKSSDRKVWKIAKVRQKSAVDDSYELVFEDELYSGKYTLECTGITDDSQKKNEINQKKEFEFQGLNGKQEKVKDVITSYWWILLIAVVIILGIVIVIVIKKRPQKIVEVDPESLIKAECKKVRLTITDRTGAVRDVDYNIEGSIFVGRSDICSIVFDDDRLSRQHFAIEVTKMACYIEDLETTNGTFVNGVKITGRRMLLDGDVITVGREKIVFRLMDGGGDL